MWIKGSPVINAVALSSSLATERTNELKNLHLPQRNQWQGCVGVPRGVLWLRYFTHILTNINFVSLLLRTLTLLRVVPIFQTSKSILNQILWIKRSYFLTYASPFRSSFGRIGQGKIREFLFSSPGVLKGENHEFGVQICHLIPWEMQ